MGFFRIGIGRRVSLGIGPVTFYGGDGRKRRPKAPGCARCGGRTPNKICASCRKELEGTVKETAPMFLESLSLVITTSDIDSRTKALNTTKKSMAVLKNCASYGVTWDDIKRARSNLTYVNALHQVYVRYRKTKDTQNADNPKTLKKLNKLANKYETLASRIDGITVTPLNELLVTRETRNLSETKAESASQLDVLKKLAEILQNILPIARTETIDTDLRVDAYNTALEAVDRMIEVGPPKDLIESVVDTRNRIVSERSALVKAAE